ncbi:MAG: prenyltransferase/squalene oxidase repeat-containing protein [Candidatus Staskawiczbacteria bacterium]|nr:prenyltransferase/squalene oxidase repeat-containing protein [Candidatus Staskawiczbacteria bacterium]
MFIRSKVIFCALLFTGFVATALFYFSGISKAVTDESQKAVDYIASKPQNVWTTMALAAAGRDSIPSDHLKNISGDNPNDYSSAILAITAINENPRTFGGSDYVAKLESFWDGVQLGDSGLLNDDIFGLLALISAGENSSNPIVVGIKNYIISEQNSDGGWSWSPSGSSDSNMTSVGIMALVGTGISASDSAVKGASEFLETMQNQDGGFRYDASDFGKDSDAASDSWAISAIYAIGQNPFEWTKGNENPIKHLKSLQDESGFFYHSEGSQENSFTPTETAYAIVALEGKFFPLKIVVPSQSFSFRIEGNDKTICQGSVAGPTALDIVKNAAVICGFDYNIEETQYGPYLTAIAGEDASGLMGWLYLVNFMSPSVGSADYNLEQGDEVLWYFGDFNWKPLKLEMQNDGTTVSLNVNFFDNSAWQNLPGATVHAGSSDFVTASSGATSISIASLQDGLYRIFAEKQGYIRSNKVIVTVGQATADHGVSLKVNILQSEPLPEDDQDNISFSVSPSVIDFGDMKVGISKTKIVKLSNNGSKNIYIKTDVRGSEIFKSYLTVNGLAWQNFSENISKNNSSDINLGLHILSDYAGSFGEQESNLTFWAMAQQQ